MQVYWVAGFWFYVRTFSVQWTLTKCNINCRKCLSLPVYSYYMFVVRLFLNATKIPLNMFFFKNSDFMNSRFTGLEYLKNTSLKGLIQCNKVTNSIWIYTKSLERSLWYIYNCSKPDGTSCYHFYQQYLNLFTSTVKPYFWIGPK